MIPTEQDVGTCSDNQEDLVTDFISTGYDSTELNIAHVSSDEVEVGVAFNESVIEMEDVYDDDFEEPALNDRSENPEFEFIDDRDDEFPEDEDSLVVDSEDTDASAAETSSHDRGDEALG